MVSSPSANCSGASGPKMPSRSGSSRSCSAQSGLSAAASAARVSQRSSVEEVGNGLDRPVDVGVGVGEREEEALELRRRDVDAALEQVTEESAVSLGVARLRVLEVADLLSC